MKMISLASGQFEDVPDDQVQSAWGTTHGFDPQQQVPIKDSYGDIKPYAAQDVERAIQAGGDFSNDDELRQYQLKQEYGGLGASAAAAGEGFARGITLGLFDPIAIAAARVAGGDEAANKTRKHLEEQKAYHNYLSGGSELVGAAVPLLLSGGTAAPEEAAALGIGEAAEGGGVLRTLASMSPAGLAGRAGTMAERVATRAFSSVLDAPVAESALGRIAQAAIRAAPSAATEGAIYGGMGELDEDVLGDHELTAEKVAAAMGHGALYGLLLGGGGSAALRGAGEAAGPLLRAAKPYLDKAAGDQMWRALDPLKKYTQEAEARAGGASEVGATVLRETGLADGSIHQAALSPADIAPLLDVAVQRKGQQIGEFLKSHGVEQTSIPINSIIDATEDVISPLRGKALHEGVVASLEEARDSLLGKLGGPDAVGFIRRAEMVAEREGAKGSEAFSKAFDAETARMSAEMIAAGLPPPKLRVGLDELLEQRKAIDVMAFQEAKALNPKMRVEQLRQMRAKLADLEVNSIDATAKKLGLSDTAKTDYLQLKKDFQRLSIAQNAVNETTARMATNRNISLSDYMSGVMPGMHAVLAGHPLAAIGGMAATLGHRFIRQHGNAVAAVTLSKLSHLDFLARAANRVDRDIAASAATLKGKAPKDRPKRFTGPERDAPAEKKFEHAYRQGSTNAMVTDDHVERVIPGMAAYAPKTTKALVRTLNASAIYVANNRPSPLNKPTIADPLPKPRTSMLAAEQHYELVRAAHDPVGTIADGIVSGRLTQAQVQTIQATSPKLLDHIKDQYMTALATPGRPPLTPGQTKGLAVLFNGPADATQTQQARQTFQAVYDKPPKPPAGGGGMTKVKPIEVNQGSSRLQLERAQPA